MHAYTYTCPRQAATIGSAGTTRQFADGQPVTEDVKAAAVGARVRRGPGWTWGDQDVGSVGTVTNYQTSRNWVEVRWEDGSTNSYETNNPPERAVLVFSGVRCRVSEARRIEG